MSGPFDWSGPSGGSKKSGGEDLPLHIQRMNAGTEPPKMKKSGDGNNLPWGGQPAEQKKAYQSGLPKDKGSMLSKMGERTVKPSTMPGTGKAMVGHKPVVKSKAQPAGKKTK